MITGACRAAGGPAAAGCAIAQSGAVAFAAMVNAAGNCIGMYFGLPTLWNPFVEPRGTVHCP
jgi:hypothetical protein